MAMWLISHHFIKQDELVNLCRSFLSSENQKFCESNDDHRCMMVTIETTLRRFHDNQAVEEQYSKTHNKSQMTLISALAILQHSGVMSIHVSQ